MKRPNHIQSFVVLCLAFLLIAFVSDTVIACPNCKNSVARDGGAMSMGFALSIGLMLAVPFAILSAWVIAIRKYLSQFR